MKYRTLGRTGLRVSVVGIGTWQFGGEWGKDFAQAEVDRMFGRASDLGVNLIDTAECYGDHLSESLIGAAIERDRDQWIVATKFGHKFHGYMNRTEPRQPRDVLEQLEASLQALRTDYIDILQFHSWGDADFDRPEIWELLEKQRQAGKIRHIGNSIGANTNVHQVEQSTKAGVEAIQVVYNRLDRAPEQATLPICKQLNLGVLARVPLASGYLSGKYQPGAAFKSNDYRHSQKTERREDLLRQAEEIARTEVPEGVNMAQWALAWCLQNPAITCVIPGCKSVEQVESNAGAADLDLVRDDHPQAA